jgi:hypothetical protein
MKYCTAFLPTTTLLVQRMLHLSYFGVTAQQLFAHLIPTSHSTQKEWYSSSGQYSRSSVTMVRLGCLLRAVYLACGKVGQHTWQQRYQVRLHEAMYTPLCRLL